MIDCGGISPLFVGGTGRSGTTIVKRVLSAHPAVVSYLNEVRLVVDPGGVLDLVETLGPGWSPYRADTALHRFSRLLGASETHSRWRRWLVSMHRRLGAAQPPYWGLNLGRDTGLQAFRSLSDSLLRDLAPRRSSGSWIGSVYPQWRASIHETAPRSREELGRILGGFFADLARARARRLGRESDPTYWLDDTPYTVCHAGSLSELWPAARFVHVHRDPRDVLSSYRQFDWGGDDVVVVADRIGAVIEAWWRQRELVPSDRWMEIGIEELTGDPETGVRRIVSFLGLETTAELVQSVAQLDVGRIHGGRWREDLTPSEIVTVERRLERAIAEYGVSG